MQQSMSAFKRLRLDSVSVVNVVPSKRSSRITSIVEVVHSWAAINSSPGVLERRIRTKGDKGQRERVERPWRFLTITTPQASLRRIANEKRLREGFSSLVRLSCFVTPEFDDSDSARRLFIYHLLRRHSLRYVVGRIAQVLRGWVGFFVLRGFGADRGVFSIVFSLFVCVCECVCVCDREFYSA